MNLYDRISNFLYTERRIIDAVLITIKQNIIAFAALVGAIAMPALPAIFAYFGVREVVPVTWGEQGKDMASWTAGVSLESLGIFSTWVAARTYRAYRAKLGTIEEFKVLLIPVIIYVIILMVVVGFSTLPGQLKVLGFASPLLAVSLYVSLAHEQDLKDREDEKRAEKAERKEVREAKKAEKVREQSVKEVRIEKPSANNANVPSAKEIMETYGVGKTKSYEIRKKLLNGTNGKVHEEVQ